MAEVIKEMMITDYMRINIEESSELYYWSDEFGITSEDLVKIVSEVGPLIHDVRLHLAKRILINWPLVF